ncbi:MAG: HlyD family secretion protein [Oligosphaeraceae bacterium]
MGDIRTTEGEGLPETREQRRYRKGKALLWFLGVVVAVVLLGLVIPVNRYATARGYVTTREYAEVRSPVTGIVNRILVSSGEEVEAGQVLVELNCAEEEATLSEAQARVSRLRSERERRQTEMSSDLSRKSVELEERKRTHGADLQVAELELANQESRLALTRELLEKGLKSQRELDEIRLSRDLCQVRLDTLREKDFQVYEELLERDRRMYASEMQSIDEELSALEDSVRRAQARIENRKIRAPIAGRVVRYEFVVGELLEPTYVIYEIFGGEEQVLKLRVDERYATRLATGQRYRARLASYNGAIQRIYFRGTVDYLRNVVQNDGQNAYRMVYCNFDPGDLPIQPGTTAEARIYYARSSFWSFLLNLEP